MEEGLTCPISLELLEDPISTPCCGHTFSRHLLADHLDRGGSCPMCRADITADHSSWDARTAPKNITIASLVENFKNAKKDRKRRSGKKKKPEAPELEEHEEEPESSESEEAELGGNDEEESKPVWSGTLVPVLDRGGNPLGVGKLTINVSWPTFQGETCLFLPVIDKSGSMGGRPFYQVKLALMHMLNATLANRNVFTTIIMYDNRAETIMVPRDGSAETERWKAVEDRVNNLYAGGGTSFRSAFEKIKTILVGDTSGGKVVAKAYEKGTKEYEEQRRLGRQGLLAKGAPAFVTSAIVVFLTDGMDNSGSTKGQLVNAMKDQVKDWTKKLTVHTVGFSRSHDFEFLDRLRKEVGTSEGIYQFADPDDDGDTLLSKLSTLANAIISSTSLIAKLRAPDLRFRGKQSREVSPTLNFTMEEGQGRVELFVNMEDLENKEGDEFEVTLSYPSPKSAAWTSQEVTVRLIGGKDLAKESAGSGGPPRSLLVPEGEGEERESASIDYAVSEEGTSDGSSWNGWVLNLVDEFLEEVIELAKEDKGKASNSNAFNLHCAFLVQRSKFLELQLQGKRCASALERLTLSTKQLEGMMRGKSVDVLRLKDASSTAPGAAPARVSSALSPGTTSTSTGTTWYSSLLGHIAGGRLWARNFIEPPPSERKNFTELHTAVLRGSIDEINALLHSNSPSGAAEALDSNGDSPLHLACFTGRQNAMKALLPFSGRILNEPNRDGYTPLGLALRNGHWKTVDALSNANATLGDKADPKALLKHLIDRKYFNTAGRLIASGAASIDMEMLKGAVPKATLEWVMQRQAERALLAQEEAEEGGADAAQANTYLQKAVENGMTTLVQKLLAGGKCTVTPSMLEKCCSLKQNGVEIARCLLESGGIHPDDMEGNNDNDKQQEKEEGKGKEKKGKGKAKADPRAKSKIGDNEQDTLLFKCAQRGLADMAELLIEHGAEVNWRNARGNTPLWIATAKKHVDCVAVLLNSGKADPDAANKKGDVPLINACQNDQPSAVGMLVAAGARVEWDEAIPEANTPVLVCCRCGHDAILNTLLTKLSKKRPPKTSTSASASDASSLAALSGLKGREYGRALVERELNKYATIDGFNPMLAAAEQDHRACIEVLARHGADIECRTAEDNPIIKGATPLHLAAYYGKVEAALGLLNLGADSNARDPDGRTPLHIAVRQSNLLVVRVLKTFGADLSARDSFGRVPLYYCSSSTEGEDGDIAEGDLIKQELTDPALQYLMAAARSTPGGHITLQAKQVIKQHAGMLGCLTKAECIDVDAGDGWTPLMEAVLRDNMSFALALVKTGADVHRQSQLYGLSACFWVHYLERDIPFDMEEAFELNGEEEAALDRVLEAKGSDVRNNLMLELDFGPSDSIDEGDTSNNKGGKKGGRKARPKKKPSPKSEGEDDTGSPLFAKMTYGFNSALHCSPSEGSTSLAPSVELPAAKGSGTLVSFFESVGSKEALYPRGKEAMRDLMNRARLFTIAFAARDLSASSGLSGSKGKEAAPEGTAAGAPLGALVPSDLSLQHVFALYMFTSDIDVYKGVNDAVRTGANLKSWAPLVQQLLHAFKKLPSFEGESFRRGIPFDPAVHGVTGTRLCWHSFTSSSATWSNAVGDISGKRKLAESEVTLILKGPSGKLVSPFSSNGADEEVLFPPGTMFKVTNWYLGDMITLGQANIRGRAHEHAAATGAKQQTVKPGQAVIVELEEVVE